MTRLAIPDLFRDALRTAMDRRTRSAWTATLTRFAVVLVPCAVLTACGAALLPLMAPQVVATVGVAGISAVHCAGTDTKCEPEAGQCGNRADKNIVVKEALDVDVPSDEGKVTSFTPAYWQPQFVSESAARAAPSTEPTAGTFAITDKSIVFAPPSGVEGVRLPMAGVLNVELQHNAATGAARQLTVESCFGRLDRFTFGQSKQPRSLDSKATADAASEVKARIAASRPPAPK